MPREGVAAVVLAARRRWPRGGPVGPLLAVVLTLVWLAPGGCRKEGSGRPLDPLRKAVAKHVADADRAATLAADVDSMEVALLGHRRTAEEFGNRLRALNARYETTREEYQAFGAEYLSARQDLRDRLLELHAGLRAAASPDEWKHLEKEEARALQQFASIGLTLSEPSR